MHCLQSYGNEEKSSRRKSNKRTDIEEESYEEEKKKKVLSFLMALSVFMTGSGIGGASAAIAQMIIPHRSGIP